MDDIVEVVMNNAESDVAVIFDKYILPYLRWMIFLMTSEDLSYRHDIEEFICVIDH